MVVKFDPVKTRIMLCIYDGASYAEYPWYKNVVTISMYGQMKWWYIKRFITPSLVDAYDYVGIFDEDARYEAASCF